MDASGIFLYFRTGHINIHDGNSTLTKDLCSTELIADSEVIFHMSRSHFDSDDHNGPVKGSIEQLNNRPAAVCGIGVGVKRLKT